MRNVSGAMLLRFHKSTAAAILLALCLAPNAFAQSTGTEAIEEDMSEVVVTGSRARMIGIVGDQTAPKSRITLSGEYLAKQTAGDTLFNGLNQLPGVNFTSNDAFGTSGGNLRIRGFDGSRVSVTFDGVPLNDSGNYALFTNQMLDSELIERVDVNLGTTDVDSPTASATGGTVAYKTRRPAEEFGGLSTLSFGEENYRRAFLRVDSGAFGPWDTKAFVSASYQKYDKFKGPGELEKKQFNAAIRQDFDNENFIQLAVHFNQNRNAFYRNTSAANFAQFGRDYENLVSCTRDAPTAGVADNENLSTVGSTATLLNTDNLANTSSCTNYFGVRINPSDTGNIRLQSLWHLGDKLRLTFDPSWQYTLANGGGTTVISETPGILGGSTADIRQIGSANVAGRDLNGDGDIIDSVRFYTPNNTNTKRWGATTSLIWDLNDDHLLRLAYTWDRARHRQTAQWGYIEADGVENEFGGRKGQRVYAADGDILRGRDRFSIAELKQFALEWRGQFLEDKFTATVGLRAPKFTRELNQYCYTPNGGTGSSGNTIAATNGSTLCTSRAPTATLANGNVIFQNPMGTGQIQFISPYSETVEFDDILPNVGLSLTPWDKHMFYLSYAQGLSAPRTDNLYSVRRLADNSVGRPTPESETTKAYDLGWRYNGENILASLAVWKIDYTNRIASSFDPELGFSVDRNVGDVNLEGFEGQVGASLGRLVSVSGSVGYTKSELLEDFPFGLNALGQQQLLLIKGNELVETPNWTYALRMDLDVTENLQVGIEGKKTGDRFSTDANDEVGPAYTVFDFDLSYKFKVPGFESAELQLNVSNLTDEKYFGTISSGAGISPLPCFNLTTNANDSCRLSTTTAGGPAAGTVSGGGVGFFSIGAPRTALASIKFNF